MSKKAKIKIPQLHFEFELKTSINILQFGCGGTGSLLLPNIARFTSSNNFAEKINTINYTLIDGDKVAKKNIIRQNFIESDIGQFKSDVLAKRYSNAFGVNIVSVASYITSVAGIERVNGSYPIDIIVSCVDNNKTRKVLSDYYDNKIKNCWEPRTIWIDSGNEMFGGQVFVQGRFAESKYTSLIKAHPEIAEAQDKLPTELSCAERLNNNEQSLAVNLTASTVIFNLVSSLLRGEKIFYYEIDFTIGNSFKKKFLDDWKFEP